MPQPAFPLIQGQEIRTASTERAKNLLNRYATALLYVSLDVKYESPSTKNRQAWANDTIENPYAAALEPKTLAHLLSNPVVQNALAPVSTPLSGAPVLSALIDSPTDNDLFFIATGAPNVATIEPGD